MRGTASACAAVWGVIPHRRRSVGWIHRPEGPSFGRWGAAWWRRMDVGNDRFVPLYSATEEAHASGPEEAQESCRWC